MLTEFNIRTLSYGPTFSRWFVTHELRAWAINQQEQTRIHNLQKKKRETQPSKKFIVSLRLITRTGKDTSSSQAQHSTATKYWRASKSKTRTNLYWLFNKPLLIMNHCHNEIYKIYELHKSISHEKNEKLARSCSQKCGSNFWNLEGRTVECDLQNWPITAHLLTDRNNNMKKKSQF